MDLKLVLQKSQPEYCAHAKTHASVRNLDLKGFEVGIIATFRIVPTGVVNSRRRPCEKDAIPLYLATNL